MTLAVLHTMIPGILLLPKLSSLISRSSPGADPQLSMRRRTHFLTASAIGPSGCVIGADVSEGMLAHAITLKEREEVNIPQLEFHKHDILNLGSLNALSEGSFGFITLASAFALFSDPKAALKH